MDLRHEGDVRRIDAAETDRIMGACFQCKLSEVHVSSRIHINGDQFVIDRNGSNPRRPYIMRTSFCLLGHYQQGHRDKGLRWLDRIAAAGYDGPRLFGENQDWFLQDDDPAFFGNPLYTTEVAAVPDHGGGVSSALELLPGYKNLVWQLGLDLRERNLIAEFCCIATIKGRDPSWTSQALNDFAQMFRELYPDPRDTPFLHEGVNEPDAHSDLDMVEVGRMGPRWRRSNPSDPSHHNYPGSTIGISSGGQFDPAYNDAGMTHRNTHPPRGADWAGGLQLPDGSREDIRVTCEKLRRSANGRPVAFNEIIHYMTQQEWNYFIGDLDIEKWAGLSTTDHQGVVEYVDKVIRSGVSICVHDRIGMSTDPDEPLSPLEIAMTEYLGGIMPDPPPPPEPWQVPPILGALDRGYRDMLGRAPDPSGAKNYGELLFSGQLTEASFRETLLRDYLRRAR